MTDFFTSLVDRALNRTPVLERRQPTLFEPAAPTVSAFGEKSSVGNISPLQENEIVVENTHSSLPHVDDNVSAVTEFSPRRKKTESQPVETQPIQPRSPHLSSNGPSEDNNSILEPISRVSIKEPAKAIRVNEADTESNPSSITKPQEITVAPSTTIETIVERIVEREVVTERSTETPAIKAVTTFAQPDLHAKPSSHGTAAEQKQSAKAEVTPLRPPKEQTAIKPVAEKKVITRKDPTPILRALSRAESRQPAKQPPAPAIHVTIGRVEVRATPPAANKPRVAQAVGPKLSLEDYLRSRGEGSK